MPYAMRTLSSIKIAALKLRSTLLVDHVDIDVWIIYIEVADIHFPVLVIAEQLVQNLRCELPLLLALGRRLPLRHVHFELARRFLWLHPLTPPFADAAVWLPIHHTLHPRGIFRTCKRIDSL